MSGISLNRHQQRIEKPFFGKGMTALGKSSLLNIDGFNSEGKPVRGSGALA